MHGGERAFSQQKVRHKKRAKTTKCTQSLVACMAGAKKGARGGGGVGGGEKGEGGGGGGGGGGEKHDPYPFRRLLRRLCRQLKAGRFICSG